MLLIIILITVFGGFTALAEDNETITAVKSTCATFITYLMGDDYESAFEYLRQTPNLISEENMAELQLRATNQAPTIQELYGNVVDSLLVREQTVERFALKLTYVIRRDYHIIRWNFVFYKPYDIWFLVSISFDDKITELFE